MTDFYKMDPGAWDFGTADLTLEQEAAYLRIVNATHKHKQPVPDNDRVIAGLFRCSTRKARALVEALVARGKVRIEGGQIVNDRAISDLVHRGFVSISRAEVGAKGGRTRAENARKALENKETPQAIASTREEKSREEESKEKTEGKPSVQKKASRLPEDWTAPTDWLAWAVAEGLAQAAAEREAERFRDYWRAKSGKDATKADWLATWRNWVRKAVDDQKARKPQNPPRVGEVRIVNGVRKHYSGVIAGWINEV